MLVGCALMTPLVLWFATLPDVRAYYAPSAEPTPRAAADERARPVRGRVPVPGLPDLHAPCGRSGPFGVLVATMPFVFAHLGKPELELFSTLAGGLIYGWLAWRTGSILWGAIGHVLLLKPGHRSRPGARGVHGFA